MNAQVRQGYKLTEAGVIPEDWDVATISETMKLINGCAFKPSEWSDFGLPIIRIQNLNDAGASFNYFPGSINERNRVVEGDLLFAWSGTLGSSFGARIWPGPEGVLNQHIFKVIPDQKKLSTEYAYIVFSRIEEEIAKKAHGFKSSFVHVKKSDLDSTFLPMPSIAEQRAIAIALSDMDALISGLDQLISKKRDIKQAAMQQLLTGQQRLPGFGGEWQVKRLGEICGMKSGEGITSSDIDEHSKYPCYGGNGLRGQAKTYTHEGAYVLIGRQGALCGNVVVTRGSFFASEHAIVTTPFNSIDVSWLALVLRDMNLNQYSESSAQPGLSVVKLLTLPCSTPPLEEQIAIATILSDMDSELTVLETRRDKARQIKQGMMQELLTGRIRLL